MRSRSARAQPGLARDPGEDARRRASSRPEYTATSRRPYRDDPAPRRDLSTAQAFLTTTSVIATRGCHNRCGFCYLATDGLHMPYRCATSSRSSPRSRPTATSRTRFSSTTTWAREARLPAPAVPRAPSRSRSDLERRGQRSTWHGRPARSCATMALAGCTGVFIGFESLDDRNLAEARKKSPCRRGLRAPRARSSTTERDPGQRQLRAGLRPRPAGRLRAHRPPGSRRTASSARPSTSSPPTPGTPLFRADGSRRGPPPAPRTGAATTPPTCVFRPKHMTCEELAAGYGCMLPTALLAHASIWRRRPADLARGRRPYLAMSLPLQALELALAVPDRATPHRRRVAAPRRGDAPAPRALPRQARGAPGERRSRRVRLRRVRGSLSLTQKVRWMNARCAPAGSANTENRPTPGTSIGGTTVRPPSSVTFAAHASQSSTAT